MEGAKGSQRTRSACRSQSCTEGVRASIPSDDIHRDCAILQVKVRGTAGFLFEVCKGGRKAETFQFSCVGWNAGHHRRNGVFSLHFKMYRFSLFETSRYKFRRYKYFLKIGPRGVGEKGRISLIFVSPGLKASTLRSLR